jgi:hypothetical protein
MQADCSHGTHLSDATGGDDVVVVTGASGRPGDRQE